MAIAMLLLEQESFDHLALARTDLSGVEQRAVVGDVLVANEGFDTVGSRFPLNVAIACVGEEVLAVGGMESV